METVTAIAVDSALNTPKHNFAKLMIGTAAGFIATLFVQKGYDALIVARHNQAIAANKEQ